MNRSYESAEMMNIQELQASKSYEPIGVMSKQKTPNRIEESEFRTRAVGT